MDNQSALTAQDVADRLKIAKNTVYELIKRGEINSYKVGRKVRFTQEDVDAYINSSKSQHKMTQKSDVAEVNHDETQTPLATGSGRFVICGQDIMLDVLSNYMQRHPKGGMTLRSYIGSYQSLVALYQGDIQVASSHLWDGDSNSYNVSYVKSLLPGTPAVIIHLAYRMQGFYVAKGNPKHIASWDDLKRSDLTMINREKGAGSRVLLDEHCRLLGINGADIPGYFRESQSHLAVASTVARGGADIGIGTQMIARQVDGIDFIPMQQERYELVIRQSDMNKPQIQAMIEILRSDSFRMEFMGISGYDISEMGTVVTKA